MLKKDLQSSERPKQSKQHKARSFTIIVALLLLCTVAVGIVGNQFVTEHSVRIGFVTTNILSLLTLAIIAFQTGIYRRQSDIMERQLVATEKAAEAAYVSQRAYIGVTGVQMMCSSLIPPVSAPIIVGCVPTLHVTWHNGGGSPAEHFRAVPYLSFGEKPERKGYLIDDDLGDMQFNFIPAGKEITRAYPQNEVGFPAFTKEMVDQLNGGQKRLYAIVDAVYTDFAGQERQLRVEAIYDPFEGIFSDLHQYAHFE
jgi:hypothetical protein